MCFPWSNSVVGIAPNLALPWLKNPVWEIDLPLATTDDPLPEWVFEYRLLPHAHFSASLNEAFYIITASHDGLRFGGEADNDNYTLHFPRVTSVPSRMKELPHFVAEMIEKLLEVPQDEMQRWPDLQFTSFWGQFFYGTKVSFRFRPMLSFCGLNV